MRSCASARSRSSASTSRRPMMPWWRTRRTGKPSALTLRSARSISASVSGSTAVPYGIRLARHGLAGFSALGSVEARGRARGPRPSSCPAAGARRRARRRPSGRGASRPGRPGWRREQERVVAAAAAPARRARRRARTCRSSSGPGRWRGSRGGRARRCVTISCAMPMCSATRSAPSSSPVATAGDTAVTASALSPRARWASAATTRRVDAAGERDDDAAELGDAGLDRSCVRRRDRLAPTRPSPARR